MALQSKDFSHTGRWSGITYTYIINVTENSVDTTNNTSNVTVKCYLQSSYSGDSFWMYTTTVTATINGTTVINSKKQRSCSGTGKHEYATWTGNVAHNADGSLSMKIDGKIWQKSPDYFPSSGITISNNGKSNTLTATKINRNFTLSFNANGGSVSTTSKTVTYGSTYGTLPTPTRTGHTFNGWYTASSGGTRKQSGDTYNTLGNSTLYAQWSVNNYSYNFNVLLPDGSEPWQTGAAGSVEISINGGSWTRIHNEAASSYLYGTTFKFRNFTPGTGLNLSSVSGATANSDGTWSATMGTSGLNINFQTAWNKYYFDLNGNLDGSAPGNISGYGTADIYINGTLVSNDCADYYTQHNYGSTYTVKDIKATTGHTYHGESSYSGTITGNTGVTLKFTTNTYTISYNANGGSGAPSSQTKTYGVNLTLSSTVPSRTGYTFLGWSTSSSATSATYAAGATYTSNSAATLYAVWQAITYTISYNANGGSGAPANQTKTYGQTLVLSSTIPTRSGYTFLGWSTSSVATSATYSAGGNYVNNSGATLYAVWTKSSFIQTIMARYQLPTGDFTDYSQVYATSLEQGDTCSWSSKETVEYKAASISYTVGTTSETKYVTVYRQQYTITYNGNGGLFPPKPQTFYYGCDLHLVNKRPTRSGYDFLGWSRKYNDTTAGYEMGGTYNSTEGTNITLYAIWSQRKTNIYLYGTGLIEASEYVETDEVSIPEFDKYGTVYANIFNEELLTNESFSLGNEFIADEISEIYIEKVYLTDESGNTLTDENGNILYMEEEV